MNSTLFYLGNSNLLRNVCPESMLVIIRSSLLKWKVSPKSDFVYCIAYISADIVGFRELPFSIINLTKSFPQFPVYFNPETKEGVKRLSKVGEKDFHLRNQSF